jgi:tetratricopeptide (TPR) repeat protein
MSMARQGLEKRKNHFEPADDGFMGLIRKRAMKVFFPGFVCLYFILGCQYIPVQSETRKDTPPSGCCAPAYYYFTSAQLKLREGDLNEAIWSLEKAIQFDSQSAYLNLELANLFMIKKEFSKALKVAQGVLDNDPENLQALTLAGKIYQQQNDTAAARNAFEKVLAGDGADSSIYLFLGRLYWDTDDMANADRVFRKMTIRFPDSYVAHYFYGKVLVAQGEDVRAEKAFLKSLALEPSLEEPRFELLKIYEKEKKPEKVVQVYRDIIENNPKNFQAALGLAQHYHQSGKPADAGTILAELGRKAGLDGDVTKTVFEYFLETKNYDGAVWAIDGMLAGAPDNSDLHYLAGVAHDGLNQSNDAIAHFQKVDYTSRFFQNAVVQSALLYHDAGKIDRAIDIVQNALQHSPDNADYYLYLGSFYEELERYNDALEALRQGLGVDERNTRLHFRLGVVYDKMGRKEDSIQAMKEVVRIKPENAEALNYLGYTYADLGINLDEAEKLIQTALKIKPNDGYITDSLGWLNYKRGRYQDALKYLNRAVELVPDDPVILEHLGDVHQKLGRNEKAMIYYKQSLEKKTKNKKLLEEKINRLDSGNTVSREAQ